MDIQGRRDLLKRGKGMAGTMGAMGGDGDGGWLAEARRKNKNFRIIGGNEVLGAGFWEPGFGNRDWELDRPDSLRLRGG